MGKNGEEGALEMEFSKTGISLEEAALLFPGMLKKRQKYLAIAENILEQSKKLNKKQIHPCALKNGEPNQGLATYVNAFLKEKESDWRIKFSPNAKKYALYNLELLGRKEKVEA